MPCLILLARYEKTKLCSRVRNKVLLVNNFRENECVTNSCMYVSTEKLEVQFYAYDRQERLHTNSNVGLWGNVHVGDYLLLSLSRTTFASCNDATFFCSLALASSFSTE